MKWLRTIVIFDQQGITKTPGWASVHASYVRSIQSIDHPSGSGQLTLRQKLRRPNGQWLRNGVKYLRTRFLEHMVRTEKWGKEQPVDLDRGRLQPELSLFPGARPIGNQSQAISAVLIS